MDRGSGNQPKKTKTVSKRRKKKYTLDMSANIPRCCSVSAITREQNKIVTLGPNKVSVSP